MLNNLKEIVKEICIEKNIEYKILSKDWIIRLEHDGKLGFIIGTRFSINSITAASIASDKYATYEVLKEAGIPIIEHKMLFNPKFRAGFVSDLNSEAEIKEYIENQKNKMVVLKANEGSCGRNVYLCKSYEEFSNNLKTIFEHKESASVCPFYEIDTEYRVICLDGEVKLIYGKKAEDGNWKHNLSQGASVIEVNDEELKSKLREIALSATKEMGIRFASVDIIKLVSGEFFIIEVNSGVTINKYIDFVENGKEIAKKIYGEAIEKMLN